MTAATPVWDTYPTDYRQKEVQAILAAVQAGECVSLVGLSGSGKSNLAGFLANRQKDLEGGQTRLPRLLLVDCNRLPAPSGAALFQLLVESLQPSSGHPAQRSLEGAIASALQDHHGLCLLLDRFDALKLDASLAGNLRALRDRFKYQLTYVIFTRQPLEASNELAELFFAHTLWLGSLQESDARWSISRFTQRRGLDWDEDTLQGLWRFSDGYPSLLRAACEAHALGAPLNLEALTSHPAVQRRVEEFWADAPGLPALQASGLQDNPLLAGSASPLTIDPARLTAKEHLLWQYLQAHPDQVCEKDDLIQAVWPEDAVYEKGIRDDSLAQVVRRLREKVEVDPSAPRYIQTVPGRGYRFRTA